MDKNFLNTISHLDPIGFIGVAKILGIEVLEGESYRQFTDVLTDIMNKYSKLNRRQRRNLLKIARAASSDGDTK